jgi:hypothetical protein
MSWIDERLGSEEIDSLDTYDITNFFSGKNILISPEGSGKSTTIIQKIYELYQKNIPDIPLIIYSAHTIENAIEKFNTVTRTDNDKYSRPMQYIPSRNNDHAILVESDSELFRKMIKAQNLNLYNFFRNHLHNNNKYIKFEIYSHVKGAGFKRIGNSASYKRKLKYQLEDNPSSSAYNSTAMQIIYNVLNATSSRMYYHILFKFVSNTEELFGPLTTTLEPTKTISEYKFLAKPLQTVYKDEDIEYFCITPESIKNWRGLKKDRDDKIKKCLLEDNKIIFTQNKVTETLLLTELRRKNKKAFVIYDEVTPDVFVSMGIEEQNKIYNILKKVVSHGKNSISIEDILFLENFGIAKEALDTALNDSKIIELDAPKIKNFVTNMHSCAGKPYLNKRFTAFDDILVLTSEKLIPSILVKSFGFKSHEWMKDYEYNDTRIQIYITEKNSNVPITKGNKDGVSKFVKNIKSYENDITTIGTSYFNTDLTLEACKGRNIHKNYDKYLIFKNPDPMSRYDVYTNVISEYENIPVDKNLKENVHYQATIDLMNQVLGRVSGLRRFERNEKRDEQDQKEYDELCMELFGNLDPEPTFGTEVKNKGIIEIYFYNKDRFMKKALTQGVRYKGVFKDFEDRYNEIMSETIKYDKLFEKANAFYSVHEDKYYFGDRTAPEHKFANLNEYMRLTKESKKSICLKFMDREYLEYLVYHMNYLTYDNPELDTDVCSPVTSRIKTVLKENINHLIKFEFEKIDFDINVYPNPYMILILNVWRDLYKSHPEYFTDVENNNKHILFKMNSHVGLRYYYLSGLYSKIENDHVNFYKNILQNNYDIRRICPVLDYDRARIYDDTVYRKKLHGRYDKIWADKSLEYIMLNCRDGIVKVNEHFLFTLKSSTNAATASYDAVSDPPLKRWERFEEQASLDGIKGYVQIKPPS